MTERPNARQAEFWNGPAAHEWLRNWRWMDQVLEPLGRALLARADAQPGERVLDVGCAHGTTTLALAEQVGEAGWVLGLDISGVILKAAKERQRDAGFPQLAFEEGDASTRAFGRNALDLVVSRFGVMFFEDPAATFRHLRRALTPGGRLAFVCWQALRDNVWMTLGMDAARPHLDLPDAPPRDPEAPGAFSFADAERVRRILSAAGFDEVEIEALTPELAVGAKAEEAARFMVEMGPVGGMLEAAEQDRDRIVSAVVEAYRPHLRDGAIRVPAAAWLVTAVASAD